jgi:ribosomal protein S14
MSDTCDRCGPAVRAVYRASRHGELYLCRPCASRLWRALSGQGWTVCDINARALAPRSV